MSQQILRERREVAVVRKIAIVGDNDEDKDNGYISSSESEDETNHDRDRHRQIQRDQLMAELPPPLRTAVSLFYCVLKLHMCGLCACLAKVCL